MKGRRLVLALLLAALAMPIGSWASEDDPVITVPADITVEAQYYNGSNVNYTASAVDRRGRSIPVTCLPASGSLFPFGTTTVTCTARDSEGRTSTKRFKISVADTKPPVISVPGPQSVTTSISAGKVVVYSAGAADVVDGPVPVSCAPPSETLFPVGTTTVTCTAADRRGNGASASFNVTVVYVAPKKRSSKSAVLFAPAAGARVTVAPMLRWRAARKASFYNVQIFRRGHKVLSAWPTRARLRMHRRWTFAGRHYRLKPGSYTWLVWPAFGPPAHPRYGKMLGQSSFVYAKG